jgi:hypothetical protein
MRLDVLTALCLAVVVAGCVSTPKPFEHDVASDGVLSPRSDKIEVAVGTPANMPDTMAARVAAALALELQAYNIVAAVQPAEAPAKVAGSMSTRDSPNGPGIEIEIEWFLFDGQRFNGPAVSKTHAMTEDYEQASDRLVSRIAQQAAPQIATLLGKPPVYQARSLGQVAAGMSVPPVPAPESPTDPKSKMAAATPAAAAPASAAPQPPQVRVMVAGVTGAPSDGDRQLFSGMRRALGSNKIVVMDKGGADVFVVSATVTLTPIDDRSGQLAVTWILKDPSGKEVGKVEQSNPVPLAAARGSWLGFGDIVATAAVEGVLQLIDKALAQQH